jgi:hypothetical protein
MAKSETLSVRLDPETRRILAESAETHDAAGASALARDILEKWVAERVLAVRKAAIARAAAHLEAHPDWGDDPEDFFPGVRSVS